MPTHDEHILRILGESAEPLFPSEITDRLNRDLARAAYTLTEAVMHLTGLKGQVVQVRDGRWTLKRRAT